MSARGLSLGERAASARALGPVGARICRVARSTGRGDSQSQDELSGRERGWRGRRPGRACGVTWGLGSTLLGAPQTGGREAGPASPARGRLLTPRGA